MTIGTTKWKQRLLVPEVVQTSAMDCGPASLKCLLEGFGIPVSYGRLREACQTDVDGTSIDTMEELAGQLGLDAEQIMMPKDHLMLPEAQALPAIVVVRLPNGLGHFVVVWRRHGPFVQVMDPAVGRRWARRQEFLHEVYEHDFLVPADYWREWAGSMQFLGALRRRLAGLGISEGLSHPMMEAALADPQWSTLATLDAATRLVDSMVRSKGIGRGKQAALVIEAFFQEARKSGPDAIPQAYWSARAAPPTTPDVKGQLLAHGAVLIRVRGAKSVAVSEDETANQSADIHVGSITPEPVAALEYETGSGIASAESRRQRTTVGNRAGFATAPGANRNGAGGPLPSI